MQKIKISLIVIISMGGFSGCITINNEGKVQNNDMVKHDIIAMKEADTAYGNKDYEKAFKLIKPLAERGDAEAQARLSVLYLNGRGVQKNCTQAVNWVEKSVAQNNAKGIAILGMMYMEALCVPANPDKGKELLDQSINIMERHDIN